MHVFPNPVTYKEIIRLSYSSIASINIAMYYRLADVLLYCVGIVICMLSMIAMVMSSQLLHNGFCGLIRLLNFLCLWLCSQCPMLTWSPITMCAYSLLHLRT